VSVKVRSARQPLIFALNLGSVGPTFKYPKVNVLSV
jgi:hypothetical protein